MSDCLILNSYLYLSHGFAVYPRAGLLANKSAMVSVLKTKLEQAVHLISELSYAYGTFKDSQESATGLNVNRELQLNLLVLWSYL